MARLRLRKNLLQQRRLPVSFLGWISYGLEIIGRFTYKSTFTILKTFAKTCYFAIFALTYPVKFINLTNFKTLIAFTSKKVNKAVFYLLKINKKTVQLIKQIPVPEFSLPIINLPQIKLPDIKLAKVKLLKPKISKPRLNIKNTFIIILITIGLTTSFYFYMIILKDLPEPNKLVTRDQVVSTKIYDRNEKLLFTIFNGNQNRSLVKLEDIPDFVEQATVAVEDKDFYKHPGFSIKGISRAVWLNFSSSNLQGGSTITQQLIKNALLNSEKTWKRKIKELLLSIQVELIYSKNEILQMYLNEVPYGGTAYGIEEAAQTYFAKSIKDITLAEAALLAGLPAAPTRFSPFGANPRLAIIRQYQVLDAMVKQGYISQKDADKAKQQKIVLAPQKTDIKAPHFVMYVKDLLVQKYGTKMVEQGGLKVITSLDLDVQEMAQTHVSEEINKLINMKVTNGAALVTNPQSGEILAMVGSRDYFDSTNDGNVNVTIMPRQPGSSIKVITYALALTNNFTPATIIPDTAITYKIPGAEPYSPVNYDNRFHGNVTLRTALASSYNIPAVKTLAVLGVNKMIDLGQQMGITTWNDRSRYGLALTLGAGEVKMTDMAVVYGTLANMGQRVNLKPIMNVTDYKGKVLSNFEGNSSQKVLDTKVAYLLTDILKDNQARMPAFGPSSYLVIPNHEVAVKTGTTNDKKDNWTIGYTSDLVVTVWVGNNDNTPMSAVASGITGASPIWNNIIKDLLKDKPNHQFQKPEDLIKLQICAMNGLLPCDGCPSKEEYFLKGTEPKYHCNSEEIKKIKEDQEKQKQDQILQGASTNQ